MYAEGKSYKTRDDARHFVVEFIESFYNRRKPHSAIGNQIPGQAMQAFFNRTKEGNAGIDEAGAAKTSSSAGMVIQAA